MRPNMAIQFLILFLLQTTTAVAKPLGENAFTEQCLKEVMSHPLGQGLTLDDFDQYVEFCGCLQDKTPKKSQSDSAETLFAPIDRCAVISLSKGNLERYFLILLTTKFELFVYDKIVGRFPAGTTSMASPSSFAGRTGCIQKNILHKCSKVHGLAITYQCIQDIFHSEGLYSEASALCPTLSTEEPPLTDSPGDKML